MLLHNSMQSFHNKWHYVQFLYYISLSDINNIYTLWANVYKSDYEMSRLVYRNSFRLTSVQPCSTACGRR